MALKRVVALAGGVGGAKLAHGLAQALPAGALTVIVNIADDFRYYGLHISPDLDTVMYTLADQANSETGWGVRDETWQALTMLERYGEDMWFRLGDQDLATHVLRRHMLDLGNSLTDITRHFSHHLGITQTILPVSDDRMATMIDTQEAGTIPFQHYFVKMGWQPTVQRIWYDGVGRAKLTQQVIHALDEADAIILCPSNPLLSIDPILSVGDMRERLRQHPAPRVAVSPLIHGQAVKGPATKIMLELGYEPSSQAIGAFYEGLVDVVMVDHHDAPPHGPFVEADILMKGVSDRIRLATHVLEFIKEHLIVDHRSIN